MSIKLARNGSKMNELENTLTSLEVAEMVGKDHSKVIRDIRNITSHLNEAKNGSVKIEDYFTFQQK